MCETEYVCGGGGGGGGNVRKYLLNLRMTIKLFPGSQASLRTPYSLNWHL